MNRSIDKPIRLPRRWTVGRLLNDLAIIMIAVPLGIDSVKGLTGCGNDFFALSLSLGLLFFAVKFGFKFLSLLNNAIDPYLPNHDPEPKPPPLDDF